MVLYMLGLRQSFSAFLSFRAWAGDWSCAMFDEGKTRDAQRPSPVSSRRTKRPNG